MDISHAIELVSAALATVVALIGATVYLTSRWRRAADQERSEYIMALEARNGQLETEVQRQTEDIERLTKRIEHLECEVKIIQDMLLRQCRFAELDSNTGGCRFCTRGLQYGLGKEKDVQGS